MAVKDWLIGTLRPDGYLKTESGKILLTTLAKGAPQPPESGALPIADEDLGKTALEKEIGDVRSERAYCHIKLL